MKFLFRKPQMSAATKSTKMLSALRSYMVQGA